MIERSRHMPWRDFSEEHSCACVRVKKARRRAYGGAGRRVGGVSARA